MNDVSEVLHFKRDIRGSQQLCFTGAYKKSSFEKADPCRAGGEVE